MISIYIGNCETHDSTSDVAQNAQTTAGTLALPSARNGCISSHSTGTKHRRLQSALLVVRCILHNWYLNYWSFGIIYDRYGRGQHRTGAALFALEGM